MCTRVYVTCTSPRLQISVDGKHLSHKAFKSTKERLCFMPRAALVRCTVRQERLSAGDCLQGSIN